MGFNILAWAMKQPVGDAYEKAVLWVLADMASNENDWCCWPAVATIASRSGASDKAVRKAIDRLVERGLVERRGTTIRRRYRVMVSEQEAAEKNTLAPPQAPVGATEADAGRSGRSDRQPGRSDRDPGRSDRRTGKEPVKNQSGADAPNATMRATRLSQDWQPSDKDIDWAERAFPDVDWRREALLFRNYWLARGDAGAAKTDWALTWQNWIANEAKFAARRKPMQRYGAPPSPPLREDDEPWQQRLAGFRANGFWLRIWGPKPGEEGCRAPSARKPITSGAASMPYGETDAEV